MFEFTSFLPRICFSVFELEHSKKLSLKLARLVESVKIWFTVIA